MARTTRSAAALEKPAVEKLPDVDSPKSTKATKKRKRSGDLLNDEDVDVDAEGEDDPETRKRGEEDPETTKRGGFEFDESLLGQGILAGAVYRPSVEEEELGACKNKHHSTVSFGQH